MIPAWYEFGYGPVSGDDMHVIRPNCRVQFTADDITFIASVYQGVGHDRAIVVDLITDPEARDLLLDDKKLLYAILDHAGCLQISARLYFFVLVRHVLLEAGIDDREASDYVAEMLTTFVARRSNSKVMPAQAPMIYVADLMAAMQEATPKQRFEIRVHLGNLVLFLVGLFPGYIRERRQRRGAPSIDFYERIGQSSYEMASSHRLAEQPELAPVYGRLSERFHATRLALNELSERMMNLEESPLDFSLLLPS